MAKTILREAQYVYFPVRQKIHRIVFSFVQACGRLVALPENHVGLVQIDTKAGKCAVVPSPSCISNITLVIIRITYIPFLYYHFHFQATYHRYHHRRHIINIFIIVLISTPTGYHHASAAT